MPASLLINPHYASFVRRHRLDDVERLMQFDEGQPVTRHRRREVVRFDLDDSEGRVGLFLKREWCTQLKDRLRNWREGFGGGTKARREWHLLHAMAESGIGCPEPVAMADSGGLRPYGFLIVREIEQTQPLHVFLAERRGDDMGARRRFACQLGREVARLHDAGFTHPDLYPKHILVRNDASTDAPRIFFVDLQRSKKLSRVSFVQRVHDLAALGVMLPEELAGTAERRTFLRSYVRHSRFGIEWGRLVERIEQRIGKLSGRRRIHDLQAWQRVAGASS